MERESDTDRNRGKQREADKSEIYKEGSIEKESEKQKNEIK